MTHSVYQVLNSENSKRYIGMTGMPLRARMSAHRSYAKRSATKSAMHSAMLKHGAEKFSIRLIHECATRELAAELERFLIQECNSQSPNGYNIRTGGEGGYEWHQASKERARTNTASYFAKNPAAREKISTEQHARWLDPQMRAKYSNKRPLSKDTLRSAQAASAEVKRAKRERALREGTASRYQIAQALIESRRDMQPEVRAAWISKRLSESGAGKYDRSGVAA